MPKHNKRNIKKASSQHQINGKKLTRIPLKSGTRQDCSLPIYSTERGILSPCIFNIELEVLARAKRQLKEIRGYKFETKK